MLKMYFEDIKYIDADSPMLVFRNNKDGGKLNIEIPEVIGFDLRTLFSQKLEGITPYFGICEFAKQIDAKIEKLVIRDSHRPGSAGMVVNVNGKSTELELFYADVIAVAIVFEMPIYFDNLICQKREMSLYDRLLWTRTESITNYSFDTES